MRVALVVFLAEGFDDDGGLPHAVEGFLVKAFVPADNPPVAKPSQQPEPSLAWSQGDLDCEA